MKKTLTYKFIIVMAAFLAVTPVVAGDANYPYTVRKGELNVFGNILRSEEIHAAEGEYFVSFEESPNKQWVVVSYDEPFERTVVWLYDKTKKSAPQLVKAVRVGKHFGVEWHGNRVFSVFWAGMGYKTSQVFSVDQPEQYKVLNDIVEYDPVRDIYARLDSDKHFNFSIVIGRVFHAQDKVERFRIKLYREDLTGAVGYIEKLKFDNKGFSVTFKNAEEKDVTETFQSKVIENAKP